MSNPVNRLKRIDPRTKFRGTVSTVGDDTDLNFYCIELGGFGDDYFNDGWWIQFSSTTDDLAPVGEARKVADYVSDTGKFVAAAIFSAAVGVGDEFEVIHERVYSQGAVDDAALAVSADDDGTNTSITMQRGLVDRVGNLDDAAPAMNAAPTNTDTAVAHLKAIRETVGQEPADADDSLHTVLGQRDDAIPAMNGAPGASDTIVKHVKAILERVGATPADPDDSLLTIAGQRDDAALGLTADDSGAQSLVTLHRGAIDRLGNTDDAASSTGSCLARLLYIEDNLIPDIYGMSWQGTVSAVTGGLETTQFSVSELVGYGDDFFNDSYWVQIISTTDDLAPRGEWRKVSDYDSAAGMFTVSAVYTANVTVNDEVIVVHENIRAVGAMDDAALGTTADDDGTNTVVTLDRGLIDRVGNTDDAADYTYDATTSTVIQFLKGMLGSRVIAEGTFTTGSATQPVDTARTEANDWFNGDMLMPVAGDRAFQPRLVVDYNGAADTFIVDPEHPFTGDTGEVAYIVLANEGDLIPATDGTNDLTTAHVVGAKADTASYAAVVTDSVISYLKGILTSSTVAAGAVSDVAPAVTDFDTNLTEASNDHYNGMLMLFTTGNLVGQAHTIYDYVGASKNCIFATKDQWSEAPANADEFVILSANGAFLIKLYEMLAGTGIAAFPAAANIANGVSLAAAVRAILASMVGGDDYDGYTNISNSANASIDAVFQKFATTIGINAANTFAPAMFGATPATIELAFAAIGTALGAEYDGTPNVYDTLVTGYDSSSLAGNVDGSIHEVLKYIEGPTGIFFEQADVAVNISVDNVGVDVFDLNAANTRYIVRDLWLKAADPGVNTLTVSLEKLINNVATVVDTFTINAANFGTNHSLMDMFGLPHLAGDDVRVYCTYSVAGPLAVTGQYSYGKTNAT